MVPTVAWMRQQFVELNKKYFGGKIPMPTLRVAKLSDEWGKFTFIPPINFDANRRLIRNKGDNGVLILSSSWSRNERSIIETMIHEMGHAYVSLVLNLWPKNLHGPEFMQATSLARADGWKMESETMETDSDVYGGKNENTEEAYLCIFTKPQGENYKFWACKATKENAREMQAAISKIQGVQSINFYSLPDTEALMHIKSDPATLLGWGAMTLQQLVTTVANYIGVNPQMIYYQIQKKGRR